MHQVVKEWCATAFERLEIDRCIIRRALLPTPLEEAKPFEGQGAHGRLVRLALIALLLGVDLRLEGMPERGRGPFHARVSEARRTRPAPVPPGFFAAACRHRCDTRIFLEFRSRGLAFPLCATGPAEAGSKDGPGAWQGRKQGAVGLALGAVRNGVVAVCNRRHSDTEWDDEGWYQEGSGDDDAVIRGQRHRTLDGLAAGRDDVSLAHVVGTAKALQGGATREVGGFEGGPAAEQGAKARRIFLLKPLQDGREGVFQRTGQAMRASDFVTDQAPAMFDEWSQRAQRRALGGEGGKLVAVLEEALDLECGVGGVVFRTARGKRCTVPREGEGIDGKEHEAIILAQCGDHRPCMQLKTHRNGLAVQPQAQGRDPRIDRFRAVLEDQALSSLSACGLEADIVFGVSSGEANKGRTCFGGVWRHGCSPGVWDRGAKGHACWRSAQAL